MKLTTFFAIAFALLLGTGFFFAARHFGWFERSAAAKEVPPEVKPAPTMVLVAEDNLFEGLAVDSAKKVKVKEIDAKDLRDYKADPDKFLAATPNAALFLVPKRPIQAGTVLKKEYFEDFELPSGPEGLLKQGMRAINVAVPKTRCVGGIIRRNDHVDIMMTCKVLPAGEPERAIIRTACIARNCRVLIKRNQLWPVLSANPDDKPVDYTIELNPYRAALLDFAQQKGQISLVAVPASPQKIAAGQYSDPTSKEYADEDERVQGVLDSVYVVSDTDLGRIFNIKPPPPKPEEPRPVVIRHITGVNATSATVIGPGGNYSAVPPTTSSYVPQMIFLQPNASTNPKDCPECNAAKKKN
jgi:Flp pilus assembly protein CpaB